MVSSTVAVFVVLEHVVLGGLGYNLRACAVLLGARLRWVRAECRGGGGGGGASHVTNTFNGGKERQAAARGKLSIGNLSVSHASQIAEPVRMGKQSECVSCLCDEVSRR